MNLLQRTVEDFTVEVLKITLRLHGVVGCGVEQFIVAVEGSDRTNLNPACGNYNHNHNHTIQECVA